MVRKNDKSQFRKLKCYLLKGDSQKKLFYATKHQTKNISESIGMQMSDSFRILETMSDLNFSLNDRVEIVGDKILLIEDVNEKLIEEDNNSLRGVPRYSKVLTLR